MSRKTVVSLAAAAAVACLIGVAPKQAEARAQYNKAFKAMYEEKFENQEDVQLKCNVCHGEGGKNKKVRNAYAEDLFKELGDKNLKDDEKIKAALEATAKKDSQTEGKTYGDLLNAGVLPKLAE